MNKIRFKKNMRILVLAFLGLVTFFSCTDEKYTPFYSDDELLISSYFRENAEFSEIYNILEYTDLVNSFDVYGTYTFFAPSNEAFENYYTENGKTTYTDFTKEELIELVKFHVMGSSFPTNSFGEGSLADTTLTGDRLVADFSEIGADIYINKDACIILKDIELPNGVVHVLDKVMPPLNFSVAQWVKDNSDKFSIMARALEETGIDDKLDSLYALTSAGENYRVWYTLFAMPDAILAEEGINSFDDLVAAKSPDSNDFTYKFNGVYRWLAYHCLTKSYSLVDFDIEPAHYGTLSNEVMQVEISPTDGILKVNNVADATGEFSWVTLDEDESNNVAKNGLVHILSSKLEHADFEKVVRRFYFGDYPGIPFDEYIDINELTRIPWPNNGTGTNSYVAATPDMVDGVDWKYDGDMYLDGHGVLNTSMRWMYWMFTGSNNLWSCTWDIPTLLPGDYMVRFQYKRGGGRATVQAFLDGGQFGSPVDMVTSTGSMYEGYYDIGAVQISEAEPHKFTLKCIKPGAVLLGYVEFRPID